MKSKISTKRFFPNALTILNMFLGFLSIIFIMKGKYFDAGLFILLAGLMDIFDGKIARSLGISSKFGVEFDSLADVVSFCVAPSLLVYNLYCENINYIVGAIFSFIPLIAGTVRLAKYNLDTDEDNPKSYFIGLSTPISTVTILSFMYFSIYVGGPSNYGDSRIRYNFSLHSWFINVEPYPFSKSASHYF